MGGGTTMTVDWSAIRKSRGQALQRLKQLGRYPLVPSGEVVLLDALKSGSKVLDVGAHDRRLHQVMAARHPDIQYKSIDLDQSMPHDYYDFSDISECFDAATLFDVIEHCSPDTVKTIFDDVHRVLREDGLLVITTPNVVHPNRLWRDCTHITPWIYYEICGFLEASGFEVASIHRIRAMTLKDRLLAAIFAPIINFLEIDHAYGIVVTARARKPATIN